MNEKVIVELPKKIEIDYTKPIRLPAVNYSGRNITIENENTGIMRLTVNDSSSKNET